MSTELSREHPSTYFVQDRSNQDEMDRLEIQDKMLTAGMGGVLPELADPAQLRRVLDVGCGTGGWLIETAKAYPTIKTLVGVDISEKMMIYARAHSETQHLNARVQFQTADALRALPFSGDFFDLVNQRLGVSWLRTWEWKKLLLEYQRVARPGGIIRITEGYTIESNSQALMKLYNISLETLYRSGRFFTLSGDGVARELVRLMALHGIQNVQTRLHTLLYQTGTETTQYFCEDMARGFRLLLPFFRQWTRVPSNYEEIYRQAVEEMRQPDFVATLTFLTAWGNKPNNGKPMLMRGLQ